MPNISLVELFARATIKFRWTIVSENLQVPADNIGCVASGIVVNREENAAELVCFAARTLKRLLECYIWHNSAYLSVSRHTLLFHFKLAVSLSS